VLQYAFELSEAKPARFKGIVIAKKNKGIDSKFTIMNVRCLLCCRPGRCPWLALTLVAVTVCRVCCAQAVDDDIVTMSFPFSSPLLKEVQVYKKWHLHGGKRRCRKAKLYYLLDKPVDEWKVK